MLLSVKWNVDTENSYLNCSCDEVESELCVSPSLPLHHPLCCQWSRFVTWSRHAGFRVTITTRGPRSCWITVCNHKLWTSFKLIPRLRSSSHHRRHSVHRQVGLWSSEQLIKNLMKNFILSYFCNSFISGSCVSRVGNDCWFNYDFRSLLSDELCVVKGNSTISQGYSVLLIMWKSFIKSLAVLHHLLMMSLELTSVGSVENDFKGKVNKRPNRRTQYRRARWTNRQSDREQRKKTEWLIREWDAGEEADGWIPLRAHEGAENRCVV